MIVPVVLSGGSGTRLWPLSRQQHPKQFLALNGTETMLQDTLRRVESLPGVRHPLVVCNEQHRFFVAEQLRLLGQESATILLEPMPKNTAPALAAAAFYCRRQGDDPLLLVMPADHAIVDVDGFCRAVEQGVNAVRQGALLTFGVTPSFPETGFGYIKAAGCVQEPVPVEDFVEKPDLETAREYLDSGDYFWNSGIFFLKASRYLQELQKLAPAMYDAVLHSVENARQDGCFTRLDEHAFGECPSDSIDYAVMEKTSHAMTLAIDVGWNDVGSWDALFALGRADDQGNVMRGDVLAENVENCYLRSEYRLIAAVAVKDLVVIETADAILVVNRDQTQQVKCIVEQLQKRHRQEIRHHRKINRPWGSYDSIDGSERFQVKYVTVRPGAGLTRQLHHHRTEHWVVLAGIARVTKGDRVFLLSENQSTYIPAGVEHRLENPGRIPLEMIEIRSGDYLREDDVIRFHEADFEGDGHD